MRVTVFLMVDKRRLRALITRPHEDTVEIAIALVRRRITPVLAPMMRVVFGPTEIGVDLEQAQAILFTSRNGVRAFSRVSERRDIKVFAVGHSTAALARNEGFLFVESAGGDSSDLARLLIKELSPSDGLLFHVTGTSTGGELRETLSKAGFRVIRRSLYEAEAVSEFSQKTINFIKNGDGDYVLFFSPRTARIFLAHIKTNKLEDACKNLIVLSLSQAVADELSIITWRAIAVASTPDAHSLLKALDEIKGQEFGRHLKDNKEQKPERTDSELSSSQTPVIYSEKPAVVDKFNRNEIEMRETLDNGTENRPGRKRSYVLFAAWTGISTLMLLIIAYYTIPYWRGFLPHKIKDHLAAINQPSSDQIKVKEKIEGLLRRIEASNQSATDIKLRLSRLELLISETGNLGERVTEVERVVGQIKNLPILTSPLGTAEPNVGLKLDKRVEKLEHIVQTKMEELGKGVKNAEGIDNVYLDKMTALEQKISALDVRLTKLGKRFLGIGRLPDQTPNSHLIVLVIGQLREALTRDQPFAEKVASLKSLSNGRPSILKALAPIEAFSGRGVQTTSDLLGKLPAIIKGLFDKPQLSNEKGLVDRAISGLKQVVTIRRIDGKGTGLEAVVARAELLSEKKDLAGVVAQLTTLQGISSPTVDAWISSARERLAVDTAIIQLNQVVLTTLSRSS